MRISKLAQVVGLFIVMSVVIVAQSFAGEITHYTRAWLPSEKQAVKTCAQEIEAKYPDMKVNIVWGSTGKSREFLLTGAAAGTFPDVFDGMLSYSREFGVMGYFMDLIPYIDWGDYLDFVPKATMWKGGVYAFPQRTDCLVYYYRKDWFEEAGIQPSEPGKWWTWSDFIEAGKKLTKDITGDGKMDQWGFGGNLAGSASRYASTFLWTAGSDFFAERNNKWSVYFGEDGLRGFKFVYDMFNKYRVAPLDLVSIGVGTPITRGFWEGKFAMQQDGAWLRLQQINDSPEGFEYGKKWAFMPLPIDKSISVSPPGMVGVAVSAQSKYEKIALELARLHMTPKILDLWSYALYQTPVTKKAAANPKFRSKEYGWDIVNELLTKYRYSYSPPTHPLYSEFMEEVYIKTYASIMLGDVSIAQGIKEIEEKGNKMLQEFEQ